MDQLNFRLWRDVPHETRGSYLIPGSLEDTDKHIKVADGHHVTAKKRSQAQIKMYDDHGVPFIENVTQRTLGTGLMQQVILNH